ncbi:ABC transporter ATP-binding protein [Flavihumibacter petaseus]|uniref:Putative copper ABC transporter ATP-binding protein n=1 Tax=Flavihumibacter petaseus NBRC 106054 TaxID=1220578 RepID=A0A0E9MY75_9BACT|nr:ABC transporter ATP-binding protein [Flavihumibacter petaseus]GAO42687.1 putative copper ABC transporter ATP-binding protein [Flavihumibacter petaseus NBRC 106054]
MIRVESLRKKFKKLQALDDISAVFSSGQVISLIGPNGSGKTTLIKTILGMVRADSGHIYVNAKPIDGDPGYRSKIGYMPQIGRYPDNMKVGHLFSMMKNIRTMPDAELDTDLLVRFNLVSIFDKPMRTLSGGTRQKVSAALAFYFNPDILILDEPTAGLDPLSSEILKEKILQEKKKNKLILITSHILSDLDELTTHIMYLQEGKMIFLKDINTLRRETGEDRLVKAIAGIMRTDKKNALWIDEVLAMKAGKEHP